MSIMSGTSSDRSISTTDIDEQLYHAFDIAVVKNKFVPLRTLLAHKNKEGQLSVTDIALSEAVFVCAGNGDCDDYKPRPLRHAKAFRLLWERLSETSKEDLEVEDGLLFEVAEYSSVEVVRFLVEECKLNVNQEDYAGQTPLYAACLNAATSLVLLKNGADPNRGADPSVSLARGPLYKAVEYNNVNMALFFLQHGAKLNIDWIPPGDREANINPLVSPHVSLAIYHGNTEMVSMLLDHGAKVHWSSRSFSMLLDDDGTAVWIKYDGTSLNSLLRNQRKDRETKLSVCRILAEHAATNNEDTSHFTARFIEKALSKAIDDTDNVVCEILLEAGVEPTAKCMHQAIRAGDIVICRLFVQHGVDPSHEYEERVESDNEEEHAISPLSDAARRQDTRILEYFLEHCEERFSTSGGRNNDGEYPIHVLCCDKNVPLSSIELAVERQPDRLLAMAADGGGRHSGLLPLHLASMHGASLDVIHYLLKRCPDALLPRPRRRDGFVMDEDMDEN